MSLTRIYLSPKSASLMIIGVPKEIKTKETRIAVTPSGAAQLVAAGHQVLIEKDGGIASGFTNEAYQQAGATIVDAAAKIWSDAEMIVKVKEPLESEYAYFRPDLILFTYLHLASVPPLMDALCEHKVIGIGYETVETADGSLPLLTPMSEVAGRIASQIGTYLLHANHGGKGVLLGGVTGTSKGQVTVIGAGHVGLNAADVAVGLGADVTVLDIKDHKLAAVEKRYQGKARAIKSDAKTIAEWVGRADLAVGAVLVSGDKAPTVVTRDIIATMEDRSVLVDVAIDQGGCLETSRPTSHAEPTYVEEGIIHYCVTNMPALTPRTSTEALTTATLPHVLKLANQGVETALKEDPALKLGLQTENGSAAHPVIARLFPKWA